MLSMEKPLLFIKDNFIKSMGPSGNAEIPFFILLPALSWNLQIDWRYD